MCHWTKNGSGSRESWKFFRTDPYDGHFCVPALSGHRKPGTDQFHPEKDPLTGLYNQEAFREAVVEILAHSKPDEVYAIEYMDINNFGYINENYGYKVGTVSLKCLHRISLCRSISVQAAVCIRIFSASDCR